MRLRVNVGAAMNLLRAGCAAVLLAGVTIGNAPSAAQPNVIHIIADDLGWTDLSSGLTNYGNGSAFYQTPNIDRLAVEGMAFTSAYAAQTCVPTRVSILTGQYGTRTGVYNVESIAGDANDLLVGAANSRVIPTAADTIGETLQAAGYTTAHIGKFHTTQNVADITDEHGFDFDFGGGTSGGPGDYFANANSTFGNSIGTGLDPYAAPYTQAYVDANLKPYANGSDVDSLVGTSKHLTDAQTDAALDFIGDSVAANDGPFYMNLAFNAVHTPIQSRPDLEAKYAGVLAANGGVSPDARHDNAAYAGLLEGMDQSIGRLVSHLQDPNGDGDFADSIAEDTVLMFYGDNGGTLQATDNTPLQGSKGSQYEGGLRVPLIAWSPGRVVAGSSSDQPVHAVDFYPTFAEFAGAQLPSAASQPLDGESLVGLLTGQATETIRDAVFFHYPGYGGANVPVSTALLDAGTNRYKLRYFYEGRNYELFDLNADLGETTNMADGDLTAGEYKLAARAAGALRSWLDDTGADYPTVQADGSPVPAPQHLPMLTFDLGSEVDGTVSASIGKLHLTLNLSARGENALFDADATGVGIASSLDTGGPNQRSRINGDLTTPEAIHFSFDTDVMLKSLSLEAFNTDGSESVTLALVSGDNPFTDLDGYNADGFTLDTDELTFDGLEADSTSFVLDFGVLGRDELFLTAGTVLSLTASPAFGGGVLLSGISVAEPLSAVAGVLLDYNLDGSIDTGDYNLWQATYGSTTDLRADGNGDGIVNTADYAVWRDAFDAALTSQAQSVPEPTALAAVSLAVFATLTGRARLSRTR